MNKPIAEIYRHTDVSGARKEKTMTMLKRWGAVVLVACMAITLHTNQAKAQTGVQISFQTFYNDLAPYGHWINRPGYGSVWIPDAGPDFQPYATAGHWEVTEYGNTWVSDYPWGWAPFHYGRWEFDNVYGWLWIPGYEWGPAWVAWRSGGGYYGWAPLPPGVSVDISVNIPIFRWFFVPNRYFTNYHVYNYCIPRPRLAHVYHSSRFLGAYYERNNHRYFYGPRPAEIERVTGRPVVVRRSDDVWRGRSRNDNDHNYRPERNMPRPSRNDGPSRNPSENHTSNSRDNRDNNWKPDERLTETQRNTNVENRNRPERRIEAPDNRTQDNSRWQQSERIQRQSRPQPQRVEQRPAQPQQQRVEQRPAERSSSQQAERQQPQRQSSSSRSSSGRPSRR